MNLLTLASRPLAALRHTFTAFSFLLLLGSPLLAASYYVDYQGGADTNAGTTPNAAWKHCPGDSAATDAAGAATLAAGDTVVFKGGVSYVFTGASGIALRWNGSNGQPITYDGNSAGTWGGGRALLTDQYGASGLSAFSSSAGVSYLTFKNFDIGAIGGAASLPADTGSPAAARFGGGITINGSAIGVVIAGCSFHDLGYTFGQRPMSADSISGTGVAFRDCNDLSISDSTFSAVAVGIQMIGSTALSNLKITNCSFSGAMVWTINQPVEASTTGEVVSGCTENLSNQFDRLVWAGYGTSPRATTNAATEGAAVTFTASAVATPTASFQWLKNSSPISGATNFRLTLAAVSVNDAAVYSVVATNSAGYTLSNESILTVSAAPTTPSTPVTPTPPNDTVATAPVILTQPANVAVQPLATATFSVTASGNPAPTYQWRKNGTAIAGWTGATLALEGVSSNDTGLYTVVVTNSAGSVTSSAATLSIGSSAPVPADVAPTITTQPSGQTVNTQANVTFTVAAAGTPAPTVQWSKNGAALAGRTGSTLTLTSVALADAGDYTATATNSAGSVTSTKATLVVLSPTVAPVFTTQPANVTVASMGTATFTSVASGTPAPTYQWKRDGVAIAGWTSATLTLAGISTNDVGTYSVVATNSAGSATSVGATLTVTTSTPTAPVTESAPVITTQPSNQTGAPNSTVTFRVVASGDPVPTYQWTRNGTAFTGWTGSTLTLEGISTNDVGVYTVVISNKVGSVTSQGATLTVGGSTPAMGAPVITQQPASQTVAKFGTATFSVVASGNPTYQWARNGKVFPGWTGATLKLEGVSSNDTGSYAVTATNAAGSVTSNIATLTVTSGKTAAMTLAGDTEGESHLANLSVRAEAGQGADSLIVGFVIRGGASKGLLIRGSGPALASYGVTNTLTDPTLSLHAGNILVDSNDDWSSSPDAAQIAPLSKQVGAFAFAEQSYDAALAAAVPAGAYTAQLSSGAGDQGMALLELYDTATLTPTKLSNLSVRTRVDDTRTPIIGFVVTGTAPKKLLVRAVGPALATFGVQDVLADPQFEIFNGETSLGKSDNWAGSDELTGAFERVGAFPLGDRASKDAATIVTAAPGAYTVLVTGANHTSGTVVVEVYELP